jgi:hypothetical protein
MENCQTVAELRALWLGLADRLTAHVAAGIEYERTAGRAPADIDSRALATAVVEGTARCLHIAGLGVDDTPPSERRITGALSSLWLGAIYGGCG